MQRSKIMGIKKQNLFSIIHDPWHAPPSTTCVGDPQVFHLYKRLDYCIRVVRVKQLGLLVSELLFVRFSS